MPLLIIQIGTPPQDVLDHILLQPHQQPSLQSIFMEVQKHQQTPYISHPLKEQHPQHNILFFYSNNYEGRCEKIVLSMLFL